MPNRYRPGTVVITLRMPTDLNPGYTIAGLVTGRDHDLPLTIGLYDAKRHEGTILPRELVKFHRLYAPRGLWISHLMADAAYDQLEIYRLLNDLAITPVVEPRDPGHLRRLTGSPGTGRDSPCAERATRWPVGAEPGKAVPAGPAHSPETAPVPVPTRPPSSS